MTREAERKSKSSRADYLPESTVGNQSYRKGGPLGEAIPNPSPPEPIVGEIALRRRVAEKAYELYEKRGHTHGHDLGDWLEAERLVLAEMRAESIKNVPDSRKRARRSKKE
jgi:hypothetical protein